MGSYLQQYGEGDERRSQIIRRIIGVVVAVMVLAIAAYFLLKDFHEKSVARHFLADINAHQFEQAYREWGCTPQHPCRDYNYQRFLEDWGPQKKLESPWKIASTDSCKDFLTVNVQAKGSDLQSVMVARDTALMGYAPSPECQERKWRFGLFFRRLLGGGNGQS